MPPNPVMLSPYQALACPSLNETWAAMRGRTGCSGLGRRADAAARTLWMRDPRLGVRSQTTSAGTAASYVVMDPPWKSRLSPIQRHGGSALRRGAAVNPRSADLGSALSHMTRVLGGVRWS